VVARRGREPEAEIRVHRLERRDERREAPGEAVLADGPQAVLVVPAVVDGEGVEALAVGGEELALEQVDQLQTVLLGGRHQRPPGVVVDEQGRFLKGDHLEADVTPELLCHAFTLCDSEHRGLAHEAGGGLVRIVGEPHGAVGEAAVGSRVFQAPEGIVEEHGLAEALVRARALDPHEPDVRLTHGERLRCGQLDAAADEGVGIVELIDDVELDPARLALQWDGEAPACAQGLVARLPGREVARAQGGLPFDGDGESIGCYAERALRQPVGESCRSPPALRLGEGQLEARVPDGEGVLRPLHVRAAGGMHREKRRQDGHGTA